MKENELPKKNDNSYEDKLEAFKIEELEQRTEFSVWSDITNPTCDMGIQASCNPVYDESEE